MFNWKKRPKQLKDAERPHTICGLDDCIIYFQDSGEIFINLGTLKHILYEFKGDFPIESNDYLNELISGLDRNNRIALKDVLRRFEAYKIKNLCEYLIFKINVPEMVKNLIFDQLNQIRRENYMLRDRLGNITLEILKRR